jgi:hypothetical protein
MPKIWLKRTCRYNVRLFIFLLEAIRMKLLVAVAALLLIASAASATSNPPIASGQYTFAHRYAEQPNMKLTPVTIKIQGWHVVVVSRTADHGFPIGVISEGLLMWHSRSKHWIIGENAKDRQAAEVGGCSAGPEVIDLKNRIYWTC